MTELIDTRRVFNKTQCAWDSRTLPTQVKHPPYKGISTVYYPPDGTGRDAYAIDGNGGTQKPFIAGAIDYTGDYIRNEKHYPNLTPMMDEKMKHKSMKQIGLWKTPRSRQLSKKMQVILNRNIERLSPEPN